MTDPSRQSEKSKNRLRRRLLSRIESAKLEGRTTEAWLAQERLKALEQRWQGGNTSKSGFRPVRRQSRVYFVGWARG